MNTTTVYRSSRKDAKAKLKSLSRGILGVLALTLAAANIAPAAAQAQGVPLVTPAGFSSQPSGGAFTMGFSFTANAGTFVNALGAYDNGQDGFPAPMDVGLWTDTGTLLLQTSVSSTDQLIGAFRYASLPSYALTAGSVYVVGAFRYAGSGETYATGFGGTAAPGISFGQARFSDTGSFAFPNQSVGTYGFFGANALVGDQVVVGNPGAVPEPATWAMMIGGFGMVGAGLRRRRRTEHFAAA